MECCTQNLMWSVFLNLANLFEWIRGGGLIVYVVEAWEDFTSSLFSPFGVREVWEREMKQ